MSRGFYIIFICGILVSTTFLYFFFKDIELSKLNFDNLNYNLFLSALAFVRGVLFGNGSATSR